MADPTVESMYEEPWRQLKESGEVVIQVAPIFYRRVKKAIIKRKNIDRAFAAQLILEPIENAARLVFSYNREKQEMTVTLKKAFDLG